MLHQRLHPHLYGIHSCANAQYFPIMHARHLTAASSPFAGEPGEDDDGLPVASPYDSIPSGFWWCIVTLLTVGYGDVYPISIGGKFIAAISMVCGKQ